MKKRSIMLGSAVLLAVLLVVGGTMAWFTADANVTNLFTAGTVKIELHDETTGGVPFPEDGLDNINPGDTKDKIVYVENTGSKAIFVRIQLIPKWYDPVTGEDLDLDIDGVKMADYPILPGWELLEHPDGEEWYYYTQVLPAGEGLDSITSPIIEQVIFEGREMTNDYQGAEFTLEVIVEAIQASNGAAEDQWRVNPLVPEVYVPEV